MGLPGGNYYPRGNVRGYKTLEWLRIWPRAGCEEISTRLSLAPHLTLKPLSAAERGSGWGLSGHVRLHSGYAEPGERSEAQQPSDSQAIN